ncbi:hypothetical protein EYF80_029095 [Liparis tanakae]|uniref:Uncharacterized protein n=1 Tax=Liparis tanakae TaxID=230148 RepID=A0A4Z2H547_9TELE|nr:hypothetical protein EYF80_029095 [Liparis tanakae]
MSVGSAAPLRTSVLPGICKRSLGRGQSAEYRQPIDRCWIDLQIDLRAQRPDQDSDPGSVVCLFQRNGVAAALTSGIDPCEGHADPCCVCRLLKNEVTGPLDTWRRDLHYRNL